MIQWVFQKLKCRIVQAVAVGLAKITNTPTGKSLMNVRIEIPKIFMMTSMDSDKYNKEAEVLMLDRIKEFFPQKVNSLYNEIREFLKMDLEAQKASHNHFHSLVNDMGTCIRIFDIYSRKFGIKSTLSQINEIREEIESWYRHDIMISDDKELVELFNKFESSSK